jgi:transcriptional regulator with XRE-family HTH domain
MFLNMPRSPKPDPALAAALRRLREDSGLTREALAFHAGITTASLARIELAQSTPGWDTIRRIAGALDLSISRLAAAVEAAEEGAAPVRHSARRTGCGNQIELWGWCSARPRRPRRVQCAKCYRPAGWRTT